MRAYKNFIQRGPKQALKSDRQQDDKREAQALIQDAMRPGPDDIEFECSLSEQAAEDRALIEFEAQLLAEEAERSGRRLVFRDGRFRSAEPK
jgi:hypothetical protein